MTATMIMVAPNGARKTREDHPNMPVTVDETAIEAARCFAAGATILHAHVRDENQQHVLDSGLYRELIDEVALRAPGMLIQITSEAVGTYQAEEQVACIQAVKPHMTSMSLKELTRGFSDTALVRPFFDWCQENQVHVQHILYSADELRVFADYCSRGLIPGDNHCILLVLGRYHQNQQSTPSDLDPFMLQDLGSLHWFVCAFGHQEQSCMLHAIDHGGHARIGFENNMYLPDGSLADHTADLVSSLASVLTERGNQIASAEETRRRLGIAV